DATVTGVQTCALPICLLLAALVRRWAQQQHGALPGLVRAAAMALPLSRFLDEAETQQADLEKLRELVPEALAGHWAEVRDFLLRSEERRVGKEVSSTR